MKLQQELPTNKQIELAIANKVPLGMDVRNERMGDKVACIAIAKYLRDKYDTDIVFIEHEISKTPFMLSHYKLPSRIKVASYHPADEIPFLDLHTQGNNDALWVFNPYLNAIGVHPEMHLRESFVQHNDIVFAPLVDVEYNKRREMDYDACLQQIEELKKDHNVTVLAKDFPDAPNLSLKECIEKIAGASLFIGGDSGFSHVAAALGVKQIALYPDWWHYGIADMRSAVFTSDWWEIPFYATPKSFLPNAPFSHIRMVELDTNHKWSFAHVKQSIDRLLS